MISVIFLISIFLPSGVNAAPTTTLSFELEGLAKDELQLVQRLRHLRTATEQLPDSWKASSFTRSGKKIPAITKGQLMSALEKMEFDAAERWSLLLKNVAMMNRPDGELDTSDLKWRLALKDIERMHRIMHHKLNTFNSRLKDGIMMNLTQKLNKANVVGNKEAESSRN